MYSTKNSRTTLINCVVQVQHETAPQNCEITYHTVSYMYIPDQSGSKLHSSQHHGSEQHSSEQHGSEQHGSKQHCSAQHRSEQISAVSPVTALQSET